ncbi:MAG: YraN family protein [Clostridiales bacterium]|jgi:putative endonuclease|nr:YraN family protein [Clostridiales bacterium]
MSKITKKNNKELGIFGENVAVEFLKQKNYKIIYRNFRLRFGEIDIICIKREYLVFIEVKTRTTISYGFPIESVNYSKQSKILKTAFNFIQKYEKKLVNFNVRFDVIEIFAKKNSCDFSIKNVNHIENIILIKQPIEKFTKIFQF